MMNSLYLLVCSLLLLPLAQAFQAGLPTVARSTTRIRHGATQLHAASYEQCLEIGYATSVTKPMGIVFGENPDPYFGLVVDDVSEGMNGGMAGLRVGDQVLAINGQVVVGESFDSVMNIFASTSGSMELLMYRGPVSALFTVLMNKLGDDEIVGDEEDDGEEEIIMDENYESPVKVEVKERKPLSAGDVFKAMGKLGQIIFEDDTPEEMKEARKEQKKKSGFFGIGGEAIQLDGDDANTLK